MTISSIALALWSVCRNFGRSFIAVLAVLILLIGAGLRRLRCTAGLVVLGWRDLRYAARFMLVHLVFPGH